MPTLLTSQGSDKEQMRKRDMNEFIIIISFLSSADFKPGDGAECGPSPW